MAPTQLRTLEKIEQRITQQCLDILEPAMRFAEIDPASPDPPPEWIAEYGHKEAVRRHRLALAAWSSKPPHGLKLASFIYTSIIRAKSGQPERPTSLSVIQLAAPAPEFPRQLVTNTGSK